MRAPGCRCLCNRVKGPGTGWRTVTITEDCPTHATHYERTLQGEQAVISGAEGRALPASALRATKAQKGTGALPLFAGPEPEQGEIFATVTRTAGRCHCGSGKLPGIMRSSGRWCCGECHNDRRHCEGGTI